MVCHCKRLIWNLRGLVAWPEGRSSRDRRSCTMTRMPQLTFWHRFAWAVEMPGNPQVVEQSMGDGSSLNVCVLPQW